MTEIINPLGMKSLKEASAKGIAEQMKENIFNRDWIFDKIYEKIILFLMVSWCFYSIYKFVAGLI